MEIVKNAEGIEVRPLSDYNPVSPVSNVIFDDEQYSSLKGTPPATPAEPAPPAEPTPPVDGVEGAAPVAPAQEGQVSPEPAATPAEPAFDMDAVIKEKTGGKFEKLDDLLQLSDKPTKAEIAFANEQSKTIYEYLAEGKIDEVSEYLQQVKVLKDAENYSPVDLLRLKVYMTPEMTQEEAEEEFEFQLSQYGLDIKKDDYLTEEDYQKAFKRAERRLKTDLVPFKDNLQVYRQEIKLPALTASASAEPQRNELDEFATTVASESSKYIPSMNEISINAQVDKDVSIEHKFIVTDEQKAELSRIGQDIWADFKSRYFKDGKPDVAAYQRDVLIRNNYDKISQSAMAKAYQQGRLGIAMNLANATPAGAIPSIGTRQDVVADAAKAGFRDFLKKS